MQLGHVAEADGRWRIYLFAGTDGLAPGSPLVGLCDFLAHDPVSPVRRHAPAGVDNDAVFDIRAIFQQPHQSLSMDALPELLWPCKGQFGLRDYEKPSAPIRRPATSIGCAASIASRAAWWWFVRTNMWGRCCRSTLMPSLPIISRGS